MAAHGRSDGRQSGDSVAAYGEIPMAAVTVGPPRTAGAFVKSVMPARQLTARSFPVHALAAAPR